MKKTPSQLRVLSIDIGGSHIKATILNKKGDLKMEYDKIPTPAPANPENVIKAINTLVKDFPAYDKISVGFPGYVKNGVVKTAPNLGTDYWADVDLSKKLEKALGKPTQVVNDADMQGLGVVAGKGLEMVITLGTGFGTALLMDGHLLPHFELAHLPIKEGITYDNYIGEKALEKEGKEKWNKRMKKVFKILKTVFNYDTLYIGGGNSDELTFKLDKNMKIVTNADGIKGGARLWLSEDESKTKRKIATPTE
ncbi:MULTISPECIES: ROK family protein [Mucilaginibacter]|jgi:polyphosphate glucokinase|uniref:Polyphosphate glucokinase n=1 Tax=Mucilaginibacter gossypii TaxID=551996 RepID=A0A1G7XFH1_9SPHI|nr:MULTISPECIES: ROK family protein [Mucilaginibacter]NVM64385.1 polyphosphate glucokinase [Mucilaginibacter sp. SG538B]QTE35207.1 ROK family protein [Mucilaginibacter gossypii]RAV58168.1 ROK family protein [Mucilaginibacter rubeus]SCW77043.1 polyphosphate glucokinase [Mucilaginibacter sp. NFR10]SDG83018.1 polyphosphate glucokinase [Mucilaginibacter gossypii]